MKRRTEITIESSRFVSIRQVGAARVGCLECDGAIQMVTPDNASALFRLSTRVIHRLVEEGRVHFRETSTGSILICPNSLSMNASKEIFK